MEFAFNRIIYNNELEVDSVWDAVDMTVTVTLIDDHTIRFVTAAPVATFLRSMTTAIPVVRRYLNNIARANAAENVPLIYTTLGERIVAVRSVFGNTTPTFFGLWDIRYLYRIDQ